MAPEQADGHSRTVTLAADVYSLGAILYELLTGSPPFRGPTPMETILKVLHEEPPRPRSTQPGVPRDLETVCLKCLQKSPARRYPSALALAEDLERFLAGTPVQARPIGAIERFVRGCLRRPVVSGLSAALLLSIVVGFALVGWQWYRAEQHLIAASAQQLAAEEASRQAEANRREADENFWIAHRAVKDFCVRAQEEMSRSPGTQPFRRELLQSARQYYQDFIRRRGNDPTLREELADVHHHLAWITTETGSRAEALEVHRQALVLYEELAQAKQDVANLTRVASTLHNIGMLANDTGHSDEAVESYQRARAIYEHLVCFNPTDPNPRAFLSNTCNSLGIRHVEAGRTDEARDCYRVAIFLREQLLREHPKHPRAMGDLAMSLHNLGVLNERLGNHPERLRLYEQARDLYEQRAKSSPRNSAYQSDLAGEYYSLALVHRDLHHKAESLAAATKSRDIRERLAQENPTVTGYQAALASSHTTAGLAHADSGQRQEAIASFDRARVILEKLVKKDGSTLRYRRDLAQAWFNQGVEYANLGKRAEAVRAYEQGRNLLETLTKEEPERPEFHHDLGGVLNNLGVVQSQLGLLDEAIVTLQEGIKENRVAFTKAPQVTPYRGSLSICYAALTEVLRKAGRLAEAVETTQERQKLWPKNGAEQAKVACDLAQVAATVGKGAQDLTPEQRAEREHYCDLAVDAVRQALANGYRNVEQLRKHPDLAPLRGRPEFEKLLGGMGG
jgi:tetratricopeptide (TPR) repeat protein